MTDVLELIDMVEFGEDPLGIARRLLVEAVNNDVSFDKSIANCHLPGVYSIVLSHSDKGMIRFYYVDHRVDTKMHKLIDDSGHFSLGVHNHKYRIAKIPLITSITNVTMRTKAPLDPTPSFSCYEYGFKSGLADGVMTVEKFGLLDMTLPQPDLIPVGEGVVMEASDLHTVIVPQHLDSAWMVLEGPQDPEVESLIYSPRDDLELSAQGLYVPLDQRRAARLAGRVITKMYAQFG